MRDKVIKLLIKGGSSEKSANELTQGENWEFAIRNYTRPSKVRDVILALI